MAANVAFTVGRKKRGVAQRCAQRVSRHLMLS
jgi:hypothetical protein